MSERGERWIVRKRETEGHKSIYTQTEGGRECDVGMFLEGSSAQNEE